MGFKKNIKQFLARKRPTKKGKRPTKEEREDFRKLKDIYGAEKAKELMPYMVQDKGHFNLWPGFAEVSS